MAVYVGDSPDIGSMTKVAGDYTATSSYVQYVVDLSSYSGQNVYIAFRHYNSYNQYWLNLDDVTVHSHAFTYSADGATITAKCDNTDGLCFLTENPKLTLTAPALTVYGGTGSAQVTLTGMDAFNDATLNSLSAADVLYYAAIKDGDKYTKGSEALNPAPTNAGDYVAELTVEGAVASVGYTIAPATPEAGDCVFTAPANLTYDGDAKAATVVPSDGLNGMGDITVHYYSDAECTKEIEADDVKNVNTYYVGITTAEADNYAATTQRIFDNAWSFTIVPATPVAADFDFTAPDDLTYDNTAKSATVTAKTDVTGMGEVTVHYYSDAERNTEVTAANVVNAGTYYVGITTAAGNNYAATTQRIFDDAWSFTITQADVPAVVTPTLEAMTYDPAKTLESVTLPDGWAWVTKTTVPTVANNGYAAEYTVPDYTNYDYTNVDGYNSETHKVTRTVALTVNKANAIAATVTANNRTYNGTEKPLVTVTGTPTGGTMQYALGTATEATEQYTTSIPAETDAGTYYVWYKVLGDDNHKDSAPACATVTIASADAGGTSSGEGSLVYNGKAQKLVKGGAATGGTIKYALGKNASTAPGSGWSESVPEGTDAGTYYVWYRVDGDANHNSVAPACVTVRIAKAPAPKSLSDGQKAKAKNLVYNGKQQALVSSPALPSGYTRAQYSTDGGKTWRDALPTGKDAGSYTVRVKYIGDKNHEDFTYGPLGASIAKAKFTGTLARAQKAAATNPVYNGKAQALAKAPASLPSGYTKARYSTDGGKTWRDALPTAKNAGSWSVLVKYVGDRNHADFTYGPVKASISKAKITIAAQDKKTTRGKALAKLTYKVTGSYVSGDSLGIKLSTTAKAAAKAGKYPISVSWNKNSNYSAALKAGTYTLADAILDSEKKAAKISMDAGLLVTWDKDGILARWGSADGAQRYEIYAAYCGKKNVCKKVGTVGAGTKSFRLTRLGGSRLHKQRPVKLNVRAYRKVNGEWKTMAATIMAHVVSPSHKKYTNAAGIDLAKDSFQLKTGGTAKIKATEVLADKRKASILETHDLRFRYASSNEKVATVSENGTITAVGKGTCAVYVYARNGRARKVAVTVK